MNKKRLIIIYWDLGIGGIQKRIRDIVLDISKNRPEWDTFILIRRRLKEGFEEQISKSPSIHIVLYPFDKKKIRPPVGFAFWMMLKYVQLKPQVCLTFLPQLASTLIIIRRLFFWIRSAVIINDGVFLTQYLSLRNMLWLKPLIWLTYNNSHGIIVPTRACKDDLLHNFSISDKKIIVIPNWTLFSPANPLHSTFDLLYVGRFNREKNPFFMIQLTKELLPRYPDLRVGMIGSGNMRDLIVERCNKEKIQKHVLVMPFSRSVNEAMRRSRILVVPSYNEGMPNVVLEAAMCGVPAVINHFTGAEDVLIQGKTGYIYTSDAEAVKYITYLLKNTGRRIVMGKRAQHHVAGHFSYTTQKLFIDTVLNTS